MASFYDDERINAEEFLSPLEKFADLSRAWNDPNSGPDKATAVEDPLWRLKRACVWVSYTIVMAASLALYNTKKLREEK